jgi:hypothetical protein
MILMGFLVPFLLPKSTFLADSSLLVYVLAEDVGRKILEVRMVLLNLSWLFVGSVASFLDQFLQSLLCWMRIPKLVSSFCRRVPGKASVLMLHCTFVEQDTSAIQLNCSLEIVEVDFEPCERVLLEVIISSMDLLRRTDLNPR